MCAILGVFLLDFAEVASPLKTTIELCLIEIHRQHASRLLRQHDDGTFARCWRPIHERRLLGLEEDAILGVPQEVVFMQ